MAVIKEVSKGKHEIELTLSTEFIKKYNLQRLVLNPRPKTRPYNLHVENFDEPKSFTFPFVFPPFEIEYPKKYLEYFLTEFKKVIPIKEQKLESHFDNLLFLAYTFNIEAQKRKFESDQKNRLKTKGKLLLELLRFPFSEINKGNVLEFLEGDPEELLAYIGVCSGINESHFLKNKGEVDYEKVPDQLWKKIIDRIRTDKNISIPLTNEKSILISKEILVRFHTKIPSTRFISRSVDNEFLNEGIISLLAKSIIDEQREYKTQFYNALLEFDFSGERKLKKFSDMLGVYERQSHNKSLKKIAGLLSKYLEDENIAAPTQEGNLSVAQQQIIYHYLVLLGLVLDKNEEVHPHKDLRALQKAVAGYKRKEDLGAKYLKYAFKDIL